MSSRSTGASSAGSARPAAYGRFPRAPLRRADQLPHRFVFWGGPLELALVVLATAVWFYFPHRAIQHYSPAVRRDMRAALTAWRPGDTPDQTLRRYFETEFGPLTNSLNRQKAFLSLFDPDLLTGRFAVMSRTADKYNQASIAAAARWIAEYRESLTPQEKIALRDTLLSPGGRAMVRRAITEYETYNANFRGVTVPAFLEMMATLNALQAQ